MPSGCPFETLGVPKSATRDDVKTRFKELAKTNHPDCGGSSARFNVLHDAYESCLEAIAERELEEKQPRATASAASYTSNRGTSSNGGDGYSHGDGSKSPGGDGQGFRGEWEFRFSRYAGTARSWADANDAERREWLAYLFMTAKTAQELDDLLLQSLRARVFDTVDIGDPLLRALARYHEVGVPIGDEHTARCFAAIDQWETWHRRRAPQSYYYPVLTVYSEAAQTPGFGATVVAEGASAVLERIQEKGMEPDDWCQSLANIVFNYFPKNWG